MDSGVAVAKVRSEKSEIPVFFLWKRRRSGDIQAERCILGILQDPEVLEPFAVEIDGNREIFSGNFTCREDLRDQSRNAAGKQ